MKWEKSREKSQSNDNSAVNTQALPGMQPHPERGNGAEYFPNIKREPHKNKLSRVNHTKRAGALENSFADIII